MDERGTSFLVVEDDERLQSALRRLLTTLGGVMIAATVADAMTALSAHKFAGLLIDVHLPDGSGVELLAHARRQGVHEGYAALVSGDVSPELVAEAFRFDAQYLVKPFSLDDLYDFASRARSRSLARPQAVEERLQEWTVIYGLTASERQLAAAMGKAHQELVSDRRVSAATVKQHIRNLLAKTCDRSLSSAAIRLLNESPR